MSSILFIHLLAIGIWVGCVATEVVCEFDQKHAKLNESYIAALHWKIDKYVEIPALSITCLTGLVMLPGNTWTLLISIKMLAGVSAAILNTVAAYTVYQRYKYFSLKDEEKYLRYHKLHEHIGVGCVLSLAVAILAGGLSFAG